MDKNLNIIEGTWLYDHQVPDILRIIKSDILYGSGDDEDPEDVREDQDITCFYIKLKDPSYRVVFITPPHVGDHYDECLKALDKLIRDES